MARSIKYSFYLNGHMPHRLAPRGGRFNAACVSGDSRIPYAMGSFAYSESVPYLASGRVEVRRLLDGIDSMA